MPKRIITLIIVAAAILSVISVDATLINYSTSTYKKVASVRNDDSKSRTLSLNTRPTAGTGGALVTVRSDKGNILKGQRFFPYQQNISPLNISILAGEKCNVYIQPNKEGQTVSGALSYSFK